MSYASFYWDQASLTLNGITVGRAEGVSFRVIGSWKPYLVPGQTFPAAIYDYGSWVEGVIRKAYLDNTWISTFNNQFDSAGAAPSYLDLVQTLDAKTANQVAPNPLVINSIKFNWSGALELETYIREELEFTGKTISILSST